MIFFCVKKVTKGLFTSSKKTMWDSKYQNVIFGICKYAIKVKQKSGSIRWSHFFGKFFISANFADPEQVVAFPDHSAWLPGVWGNK